MVHQLLIELRHEYHFKECRNRQARKLDQAVKEQFKRLCTALFEAESRETLK